MYDKTYILLESVEQNRVIDAIKNRYEVRVSYKADNDSKGSGERIIQPVAYGLSKSGNPVVRAFQPYGDTKTKVPHWKLFRLDKFESWGPLRRRKFSEPPQSPFNVDGKFNPNGDKSMSEVYIIADFKGTQARYERGGLKKYNELRTQKKTEENPYYKLKKNIEKSIKASPDVMKNVQRWKASPEMSDYLNGKHADEIVNADNYGDRNISLSNGPITKGAEQTRQTSNTDTMTDTDKERLRDTIIKNGPIVKGEENMDDEQDFEDSQTENDNNTEENTI